MGFRGQRGGTYSTSTPRIFHSLSKGHLEGTALIHFFASSGVHSWGSSQGILNFGKDSVNLPHHRGGRVRAMGVSTLSHDKGESVVWR
jgi:hypothetical protein